MKKKRVSALARYYEAIRPSTLRKRDYLYILLCLSLVSAVVAQFQWGKSAPLVPLNYFVTKSPIISPLPSDTANKSQYKAPVHTVVKGPVNTHPVSPENPIGPALGWHGDYLKQNTLAQIPTPVPLEDITGYITMVFKSKGPSVVVEAINCLYSESKFNPKATGYNKNGSIDRGLFQLNSVHKMKPEDAYDYKKNIDRALAIYESRGNSWAAWYGPGCKKLTYK